MRRGELITLAVALSLFFTATLVYAEEKWAYVNVEQLLREYKKAKEYDKLAETKQKRYEKERQEKVDEIKKLQEKISLLSEEEKETRRKELEDKIAQLQQFDRSSNQDFRKEMGEKSREISRDVEKSIQTYAKKEGLTFVFDKRALLYENESLDITDEILKILNKE